MFVFQKKDLTISSSHGNEPLMTLILNEDILVYLPLSLYHKHTQTHSTSLPHTHIHTLFTTHTHTQTHISLFHSNMAVCLPCYCQSFTSTHNINEFVTLVSLKLKVLTSLNHQLFVLPQKIANFIFGD